MAIVMGRDGKAYSWSPTIELLCSKCLEPFDVVSRTLQEVNFTFDYVIPDPLQQGEYWYFHKRCARIEDTLEVNWGWFDMKSVLGLDSPTWKQICGNVQKYLRKRMPTGAYEHLYAQWLPAIKPTKHAKAVQPQPRQGIKTTKDRKPAPQSISPVKPITVPKLPTPSKSRSWMAIRFSILQRDGYRCLICGASARDDDQVRLEVDHITPRSRGGTNDPENLWTLCYDCNHGKGIREL